MNQHLQESKMNSAEERKMPFWRVLISVLQASFGVQNKANRERDFTTGSFLPFVIAALLFTGVFIFTLVMIVNKVLSAG